MIRIDYAPDLVEEAVLLAERTMSPEDRRAFRRARDPLYELPTQDSCRPFQSLHWDWFRRLRLDRVVAEAVSEREHIRDRLDEARIVRALTSRDESADLIDRVVAGMRGMEPVLVVRLRPAALLDPDALRGMLRHELMHVDDMLDPAFEYERSIAAPEDEPSVARAVRDRYRVLWDVTIDGRLTRAGLGDGGVRAARWKEFDRMFGSLGDPNRDVFDELFDRVRPTHQTLLAFARMPNPAYARIAS